MQGGTTRYLKAPNPGNNDRFGFVSALSTDGTTLAVGAIGEDSQSSGVGGDGTNNALGDSAAVYVFY